MFMPTLNKETHPHHPGLAGYTSAKAGNALVLRAGVGAVLQAINARNVSPNCGESLS